MSDDWPNVVDLDPVEEKARPLGHPDTAAKTYHAGVAKGGR